MKQPLRSCLLVICLLEIISSLYAQPVLTTQALATTSVCAGSVIDVSFTQTGTYGADNTFRVQLSDGEGYRTLETAMPSYNSSTGLYAVQATIPATQKPGRSYTVRVIASSPVINGTPSPSALAVNAKPIPPLAPSTITECARPLEGVSSMFVVVSLTATVTGAKTQLYDAPVVEKRLETIYTLAKPGVGTYTYYAAQTVDGCESDRVPIKLTVQPIPDTVTPLNVFGGGDGLYGKITYCQYDKAVSLKEYGIRPLPDNVYVNYKKESGDLSFTGNPPIPNTDKAGTATYTFMTYLDGCPSSVRYLSHLTVTVKPRPDKPIIPANTVAVCVGQLTKPASVSTAADGASLVWYATTATGGISSITATMPLTVTAGTATYQVAQRVDGCESERTPVTVDVRPLPTAALTGTQRIYEGQSAKLSVAFTGDAPWTFSVQDSSATGSGAVQSIQTAANPHTLDVSPTQSTAYVLRDVQNGCGLTKLTLTPVLVTVDKALGVEDQALAEAIDVYPVPAATTLTVRLRGLSPAQTARIELISETGLAAWQTETRQETSVLSLDQQPAGVYVLRIRVGDRTASRRIVKR
ncbi:Ig-like domain-containing protein [Spirosoma rhododendri]|uniref:T9SS type A sorting domain-containing protein n=1 Tax=Spirosoma rhododendri TaxID=2728024 RepID=A0A7L5DIY5_9BACT|nr:T9SS type A sorting domain-containing protein [Spirosoma rhododendri]QJD77063.1 T9SS type A sorting domain-containing protein [Spirosoma rhododendri]